MNEFECYHCSTSLLDRMGNLLVEDVYGIEDEDGENVLACDECYEAFELRPTSEITELNYQ